MEASYLSYQEVLLLLLFEQMKMLPWWPPQGEAEACRMGRWGWSELNIVWLVVIHIHVQPLYFMRDLVSLLVVPTADQPQGQHQCSCGVSCPPAACPNAGWRLLWCRTRNAKALQWLHGILQHGPCPRSWTAIKNMLDLVTISAMGAQSASARMPLLMARGHWYSHRKSSVKQFLPAKSWMERSLTESETRIVILVENLFPGLMGFTVSCLRFS